MRIRDVVGCFDTNDVLWWIGVCAVPVSHSMMLSSGRAVICCCFLDLVEGNGIGSCTGRGIRKEFLTENDHVL